MFFTLDVDGNEIKVGDLVSYTSAAFGMKYKSYGIITRIDEGDDIENSVIWASWRETVEEALEYAGENFEKLYCLVKTDNVRRENIYTEEDIWE